MAVARCAGAPREKLSHSHPKRHKFGFRPTPENGPPQREFCVRAVRQALSLAGMPHLGFELWWKHRRHFEPITHWNTANKAFFIHIPKTAGTSIYDALGMITTPYTHAPARILASLYPAEYAQFFTFSFVRNPWDRFVSTYEFLRQGTEWEEQKAWARAHIGTLSMDRFVQRLGRDRMFRAAIMSYEFFFPQSYFLTDRKGKTMVERIYRFEDIGTGFVELADRFGVEARLGHKRRTQDRKPFSAYYDAQSWAIIGKLYVEDIHAFGYGVTPTAAVDAKA